VKTTFQNELILKEKYIIHIIPFCYYSI